MGIHYSKSGLKEYLAEKEEVFEELFILDKLTSAELAQLRSAKNEIQADQIARRLIMKYLED